MNSKFDQFDMNEEILRASGEWYKDKWNLQWKIYCTDIFNKNLI